VITGTYSSVYVASPFVLRCPGLAALDNRARHPGSKKRDEGNAKHHLYAADEPPHVGSGRYVAVPHGRDRLERPPDRKTQAWEVVLIGDPDDDGADERERDEG
jgi:hypothetical protein